MLTGIEAPCGTSNIEQDMEVIENSKTTENTQKQRQLTKRTSDLVERLSKRPSGASIARTNRCASAAAAKVTYGAPIVVPGTVEREAGSSLPSHEVVSSQSMHPTRGAQL